MEREFKKNNIKGYTLGVVIGSIISWLLNIGDHVIPVALFLLTVGQIVYISVNNDNIELLHDEIKTLKKKLNKNK